MGNSLAKARVLIIGIGGQDARILARLFTEDSAEVWGVSRTPVNPNHKLHEVNYLVQDLSPPDSFQSLLSSIQPHFIFHLAAVHGSSTQMNVVEQRLWREKIDLMQVHSLVNVDQIVPVLKNWKKEGKIRYVGVTHHEVPYFPALAGHVERSDLDFVQVHYSIQMRLAEERILPAAVDKGTAVLVNMPFEKARLFSLVQGRPLPDFAKEIGCENWAQYFLKWVISHPAITCVIPATSNPAHQSQNIGALRGPLPDKDLRSRMLKHMESIPGFDKLQDTPPYPGKSYQGLIRRGINARTAAAK
ncbi:MAG: NAD-dependent epimerase/dehydratase family protein [Betaproteobacteria bacterium]|nr:NAD-dependent epimerase/dehydratase family protein [Betaproteobacteria bacterium]